MLPVGRCGNRAEGRRDGPAGPAHPRSPPPIVGDLMVCNRHASNAPTAGLRVHGGRRSLLVDARLLNMRLLLTGCLLRARAPAAEPRVGRSESPPMKMTGQKLWGVKRGHQLLAW